ncbi:MAG: PAS domain-containing protein [Elusimicrobiota bacterium]
MDDNQTGLNKRRGWLTAGMSAAALAAGVLLVWWMIAWADHGLRAELLLETRLVARAVNIDRVKTLTGTDADLKSPDYIRLKEQFAAVLPANPKCWFIYLLGRRADGTVFFFVDSEPAGSKDYSPPGEIYADISAEDRRVVDTGADAVTGPASDRWGEWISGLVSIYDPRTGAVAAVLGMDIDASDWQWAVAARAALPAGLLLAFGLALFMIRMRVKARQAAGLLTAELREISETHRRLIENSHDIIYLLTADGIFTFVSPAWTTLLGHPVNQVVGQPFQKFVHPDDLPGCMVFLRKIVETGQRQSGVEYRVKHLNGEWLWHTSSGVPLRNDTGAVIGFEGIARDITKRKKAELALKEAATRLSLAVRAGGVGVWDYDIINNILLWDDQMYALYGIKKDDFKGAYESWKAGLHPDDLERSDAEVQMAIRSEKEFNSEFRVVWPDGSIHHIRALAIVQRDDSGAPQRLVGTNWDITEHKAMERQIAEAEKLDAIGYFITGTAHELNNPLATMISFSETMLGKLKGAKGDAGKLRESAEIVLRNAIRCEAIVTSLMSYGRTQASQFILLDVNEVIDKSLTLAESYCRLEGINIHKGYSAGLPPVTGNKEQLTQVFTNIIRNAVQAMKSRGELRIETKAEGKTVSVVFTDSGEGIAPDKLPKLFYPFFTTREPGQGTGLGLSVSAGIIRAHNGKITAASPGKGKGASFTVSLPITAEDVKHG